ncbi:MAG: lipopolysaccharide core heptose(II) kinase RfaY [Nanoarchaeota archaeon]
MVNAIIKQFKDINRLREILTVLGKQGFGYLIDKIRLSSIVKLKRKKERLAPEVRLRLALEKLGPTFIKLGQILSLRPDLIPPEYVKELGNLQDRVPPFSYSKVEEIIKKEFGRPIKSLFQSFDKKPIASASISQVHKAQLKSGETVAVKIQRPDVTKIMNNDIEIMYRIAQLLEKYAPNLKRFNPTKIVEEFQHWTTNELNFITEAQNAKRFYKNFQGDQRVIIPKIFDNYSTKRILTSEFIDGIELHNLGKIKGKRGYDLDKVIKNGLDIALTQIFIHGFFHADPHPGNIMVLKNNKIALIDFGIVGYFNDELKQKSINLFYGIMEEDLDSIVDTFSEMGLMDDKTTDIELFKSDIKKIIEPLQKSSLKDVKVSHVLEKVLAAALYHHIKMPVNFVLFGKTIVEIEGIALEYSPNFKFADSARPFLEKLIKNKFSIKTMPKDFIKSVIKFKRFIQDFPTDATKALKKVQEGKIKVDIEDTDIKRLSLEIDRSSNRLAYGMLIAALIIAGALTINVNMPKILDIPWISFIAYLIAAIMGIVLLYSILNEKKLLR